MSAPENFVGPFFRLMDALRSMPPMIWEGHDAATVGWDAKPDPEEWAVVQWIAKNVRPELLAHQTFKSLRASGLFDVGPNGEVVLLTPEAKQERAEVRKKSRIERSKEKALIRQRNRQLEKEHKARRAALGRRKFTDQNFLSLLSEYNRSRGSWPFVEDLLAYITAPTDESGLGVKMSRMTMHRYRMRAEAELTITTERAGKYVRLIPGPKFPAELLPHPIVDDSDLAL